jgi:hypothetical protein
MSIRAHRVNEIKYKGNYEESFNLYHDDKLMDFLGCELSDQLNCDGAGMAYIAVDTLKDAIKKLKLEDYRKESLKADIAWAKANDEDYVRYDCF